MNSNLNRFKILEDGSIIEKIARNGWNSIPMEQACVDGAQNFPLDDKDAQFSGPFSGDEKDTVVIDCRSFVFTDKYEHDV